MEQHYGIIKCYLKQYVGKEIRKCGEKVNPTRFQHPVAGTYKKECIEQGKKYFSAASGGGTGRTLHPDNMAAGPASYGMTEAPAVAVNEALNK